MTTKTSVFCAVWHKDPDRHQLLQGHQLSLDRQTRPVERIYVFDNGDEPPSWLTGKVAVAQQPLGIYEAWNVGAQLAQTKYVMNLNLDDRLAPDAVARLEDAIESAGAGLTGGEWKICYSQEETDAVAPAYPALDLQFDPAWPPSREGVRLGSGTGERGTLGPASLWRRALHDQYPFPYRFSSGAPITSVADLAWWNTIGPRFGGVRVPLVVGHYYSHPGEQAEFRGPDENARLATEGVRYDWYPLDGISIR